MDKHNAGITPERLAEIRQQVADDPCQECAVDGELLDYIDKLHHSWRRDSLAAMILEAIRREASFVEPKPTDEFYDDDLSSAAIDDHFIDMRVVADALLVSLGLSDQHG